MPGVGTDDLMNVPDRRKAFGPGDHANRHSVKASMNIIIEGK